MRIKGPGDEDKGTRGMKSRNGDGMMSHIFSEFACMMAMEAGGQQAGSM